MKEVQKVQVSPRLWYVMFFGVALFVAGFVAGALSAWPGTTSEAEQSVKPQPTMIMPLGQVSRLV